MGVEWRSFHSGQEVPQDAIKGGQEPGGETLYVARAHVVLEDGSAAGLHPGKFGETTGRGVLVGYAGREKYFGKYDLLCGDQNSVKWIDMSGRLPEDISSLNLVEGGQDGDGNPLYVAQVEIKGAVVPGKTGKAMNGGTAAFGGEEINDNMTYRVLAHA